ncbi:MAG: hypothetical protein ABI663_21190 [Chryseolinea sp.]
MKTSKDVIRQASLFTMGGLIDPRLMPDYEKSVSKSESKSVHDHSVLNRLRKSIESITGRKINNEPAQG